MDADKLARLRSRVAKSQTEHDQAAGALAQVMRQIKDEFDCDGIEAAEKLMAKKQRIAERLEAEAAKALEEFEVEYGSI